MSEQKTKKDFNWAQGHVLKNTDYKPLGNVREIGFSKIADGIYADPIERKEQRKKRLLSKPVRIRKEGEFFIEESSSGLAEITPADASHLLKKDSKKIKGIGRFNKQTPRKTRSS